MPDEANVKVWPPSVIVVGPSGLKLEDPITIAVPLVELGGEIGSNVKVTPSVAIVSGPVIVGKGIVSDPIIIPEDARVNV